MNVQASSSQITTGSAARGSARCGAGPSQSRAMTTKLSANPRRSSLCARRSSARRRRRPPPDLGQRQHEQGDRRSPRRRRRRSAADRGRDGVRPRAHPTEPPRGLRRERCGADGRDTMRLVGIHGELTGRCFDLGTAPLTMGRGADNHVILSTRLASRHHAELRPDGGGWTLHDGGSTNGTAVNGRRVRSHRVRPGDEIAIGHEVFRLEVARRACRRAPHDRPAERRPAGAARDRLRRRPRRPDLRAAARRPDGAARGDRRPRRPVDRRR